MLDFTKHQTLEALVERQRELAADLQILEGVITRLRGERARAARFTERRPVAA